MIESFITEDNNNLARRLTWEGALIVWAWSTAHPVKPVVARVCGAQPLRNTGDPGASNAYHGQQARGSRQFFGFCMRRQRDRQVLGDPQSGQGLSAGKMPMLSGEE